MIMMMMMMMMMMVRPRFCFCLVLCLAGSVTSRDFPTNEVRISEDNLGSRPPSCDHKCYGCNPCEAIQVPTTSSVGVQYTNYEPEGWKCKCGPTFYTPYS